jgi:hypothetical protein
MSVRTVFQNVTIRSKKLNISFSEFFERLFCTSYKEEILNRAEARVKSLAFHKLSENTKCSVLCDDMTASYEKYFRTIEACVIACQTEVKKTPCRAYTFFGFNIVTYSVNNTTYTGNQY